jgi:ferredoxin
MAVVINDTCINCGACIDECPVEAIVDEDDNPTGEEIYYVYADKCVECVGHHDEPACASACPTEVVSLGMKSVRARLTAMTSAQRCVHQKQTLSTNKASRPKRVLFSLFSPL